MAIVNLYCAIITLVIKTTLSIQFYSIENAETLFKEFTIQHGKNYSSTKEYIKRLEIFKIRLEEINELNKKANEDLYGVTQFSDMTWDEFSFQNLGLGPISELNEPLKGVGVWERLVYNLSAAPDSVDWRNQKVLTEVKNQGICNSCWAFSAISSLESKNAMVRGTLVSLSEEQIVDCFAKSCDPGWPHLAFKYLQECGGANTDASYPYKAGNGRPGRCQFNKNQVKVKVRNSAHRTRVREEEIRNIVANYGPVSVGMHIFNGFENYRGKSIFKPTLLQCPRNVDINHAVNIVGYGEEAGTPYWIIRNSWGKSWGDGGYFRMVRGRRACQLGSYVALVEVA